MGVSYHLPNLQLPPPVSYWNVITIHEGRFLNINLIQIMKKNVSNFLCLQNLTWTVFPEVLNMGALSLEHAIKR